jgi:hypothetical protein
MCRTERRELRIVSDGQEESPPWRLVGAVDGTTLTYVPSMPAGAPATLKQGEVLEFNSAGPFVVKSQDDKHPFDISGHMTGCGTLGQPLDCRGDPEFVNVIPAQQYLNSYVFFTDPTYPETDLVVTRSKANGAFADVTLDCLGGPVNGWQPVGSSGEFEYTRRRSLARQLREAGRLRQRSPRDEEHRALRPDGVGLGLGSDGRRLHRHRRRRLLQPGRQLRLSRGCRREAGEHRRRLGRSTLISRPRARNETP